MNALSLPPADVEAPRASRLTARQRKILEFIEQSIREKGYPPTLREIGMHMGIRSTNGVSDHLRALERKGYLQRADMKSRGMSVLVRSDRAPEIAVAVDVWQTKNAELRGQLQRACDALAQASALSAAAAAEIRDLLRKRAP